MWSASTATPYEPRSADVRVIGRPEYGMSKDAEAWRVNNPAVLDR
jgi:hypothetical protein